MFGKITAPAPETEVLIRFSFFALGFFVCCFFLVAPVLVHDARRMCLFFCKYQINMPSIGSHNKFDHHNPLNTHQLFKR